jgi:hypothetical protein
MQPRVSQVSPLDDYLIMITFDNKEKKVFDMKPYLHQGLFSELQDQSVFRSVRPFLGSIQWNNGLDLCPDTLYEGGTPI